MLMLLMLLIVRLSPAFGDFPEGLETRQLGSRTEQARELDKN